MTGRAGEAAAARSSTAHVSAESVRAAKEQLAEAAARLHSALTGIRFEQAVRNVLERHRDESRNRR